MGNLAPTLDYAAPLRARHARLKKWTRRISLGLMVLVCLYAAPLAWLYVGWRQEKPARQMAARLRGTIDATELVGPAWLDNFVPAPLGWIRERITTLNLSNSTASDEDLRPVARLARLQKLYIGGSTRITDAGLAHIEGLARLQELDVQRTQMTDAGLLHIAGLTRLRVLDLGRTRITDAGLAPIAGLTGLQRLYLGGTALSDAGLVHVRGLTRLQVLVLGDTRITDAGLLHLRALTGLQWLWLRNTLVDDAGLVHIAGFPGLRTLDLADTRVTDGGLARLRGLTGLQQLWLSGSQVTPGGAADLRRTLPQCQISR